MAGRRRCPPGPRLPSAAALVAVGLLAAAGAVTGAAPLLQMAQPTLTLPATGNGSEASSVLIAVQLLGDAGQPVNVSLTVLLPSAVAGSSAGRSTTNSSEWATADPELLWLEPATLSWTAGEAGRTKQVRLQSSTELPLVTVLQDAVYASAAGGNSSSGAGTANAEQPLLRVQLAAARGAAIARPRSSTTLVSTSNDDTGSEAVRADQLPLFGFVANQAAYRPSAAPSSSSSSSSSSRNGTNSAASSGAGRIPVRLLSGQLREAATLSFTVRQLTQTPLQRFLPTRAASGFLYFTPQEGPGSAAAEQQQQQQQWIELPLAWDRIPPEAEYRLGVELYAVYGAQVLPQPDAVALHIFGTPAGTCPPGTVLQGNGNSTTYSSNSGSSILGMSGRGSVALVSGGIPTAVSSGTFAEGAGFELSFNGSVINLSSSFESNVHEYGAMVESDVEHITLCLRAGGEGNAGSVTTVPAAGSSKSATKLKPASVEVAEALCGCDGSSSSSIGQAAAQGLGTELSTSSSCEHFVAWLVPLRPGQNCFTIELPHQDEQQTTAVTDNSTAAGKPGGQYKLTVVRLADPENAELESITVKSSDDSAVVLCGPSSTSGRPLASRAALGVASSEGRSASGMLVLPAAQPCKPGALLSLNVSDSSQLISLSPSLKRPDVPGIRVEVNGQVLSRGGDVAADRLEDTTAAQQQRSNASFLPSAFIMGLQPGAKVDAEVVVVAEDGVTTSRYPIQFVLVESEQKLLVAEAGDRGNGTAADRKRGWPISPAMQPFCLVCPPGWAASAMNSSACHMCPPGTYAPGEHSPACLSCTPGTFAYSWGSAYCKNCIEGTYAPEANSSLCLSCPANTTTLEDGQSECSVPLTPEEYQAPRYAVVVSFYVILTGVEPDDVVMRAGVNAAPEAIVTSLIRADTAQAFNISLDDVQVVAVRRVARRTLSANVTATLGVEVPAGATDEDISAALEVQRLSADDPIDMLSADPDRFFGRTTKTLDVEVQSAVQATIESRPGGTNMGLLWGMLAPGILAIVAGSGLVFVGCRKSRACAKWRGAAACRLATTRLAPRAVQYARYAGEGSAA